MKLLCISIILLVISGALVLWAPHHRQDSNNPKPCTLGELYWDIIRHYPSLLETRGAFWLLLFTVCAGWATLFPTLAPTFLHGFPPRVGRGPLYGIIGCVVVFGAIINFIVMLLSHVSFGFGASNSSMGETPFLWIIPLFQALFGLIYVAAAVSSKVAGWLEFVA